MILENINPLQSNPQSIALANADKATKKRLQIAQQGNDDTAKFSAQGRSYVQQNLKAPSAEPKFTYANTANPSGLKANKATPQELLNLSMPSWYAKAVTPEFAVLKSSLGQKFDPAHQNLMDSTSQERQALSTSMREKLKQAMKETGIEQLAEVHSSPEKNEELKTAFYKLVDEDESAKELFKILGMNI